MNFCIYTPGFKENVGGIMVLYNLAKDLIELGNNVKIYVEDKRYINNIFCNNFLNDINDIDINNYIAIYPEGTRYNPLSTKKVIRWILCRLDAFNDNDIYKTWDKNDIIYNYSSYEPSNKKNLKFLFSLYINPIFKNINTYNRQGTLYLYKKANIFHKNIKIIHDSNALYLNPDLPQEDMYKIFNYYKYIIIYDPYTYIMCMAAMCGCIPIVYPIENVSKKDWTNSIYCYEYLKSISKDYMYGIAYGLDDVRYAINTINLVSEEQLNISKYGKKTVYNMMNDLNNDTYTTVNDIYYNN